MAHKQAQAHQNSSSVITIVRVGPGDVFSSIPIHFNFLHREGIELIESLDLG